MAEHDVIHPQDWQECRAAIGRFDTILASLRQYSFTLITGFIAGAAFLNLLGVKTGSGEGAVAPGHVKAAAIIVIFVLIASLFAVDSYYQVLMCGAVERALDIEAKTRSHRLTRYISTNVYRAHVSTITLILYYALLGTAGILGLAMFPGYLHGHRPRGGSDAGAAVMAAFFFAVVFITADYVIASKAAKLTTLKPRIWPEDEPSVRQAAATETFERLKERFLSEGLLTSPNGTPAEVDVDKLKAYRRTLNAMQKELEALAKQYDTVSDALSSLPEKWASPPE
jgi:hypothetical protein